MWGNIPVTEVAPRVHTLWGTERGKKCNVMETGKGENKAKRFVSKRECCMGFYYSLRNTTVLMKGYQMKIQLNSAFPMTQVH